MYCYVNINYHHLSEDIRKKLRTYFDFEKFDRYYPTILYLKNFADKKMYTDTKNYIFFKKEYDVMETINFPVIFEEIEGNICEDVITGKRYTTGSIDQHNKPIFTKAGNISLHEVTNYLKLLTPEKAASYASLLDWLTTIINEYNKSYIPSKPKIVKSESELDLEFINNFKKQYRPSSNTDEQITDNGMRKALSKKEYNDEIIFDNDN